MQLIDFLAILCLFGVTMAFTKRTSKNVFETLASKFPQIATPTANANNTVTTGYMAAHSYFNSANCSTEIFATEWIALGQCSPYAANYSDPAAVPQSCGGYVSATASFCNATDLCLTYNFFTDAICSLAGTGACTQTLSIPSTCYAGSFGNNGTTSTLGMLMGNYSAPYEGYSELTYNEEDCTGMVVTGYWQSVGCTKAGPDLSIYGSCVGNSYDLNYYGDSDTCSGQANNQQSTDLHACQANVFDESETEDVVFGMGYSQSFCNSGPGAPSAEPTAAPTGEPTADPTAAPTAASSEHSPKPSFVPTFKPTAGPTMQTSPVVQFTSNVTLGGLTSPTLDADSQAAVVSATALSMGIDSSNVVYVNSLVISSAAVHLVDGALHHGAARLGKDVSATRSLRAGTDKQTQAVYTVKAITRTTIALASTTYTSTDALYSGLTTAFATAVNDGSYAAILQNSGVAELAAVTASDPASSPATVIEPPSSGGKNGLSGGAIAGIVIGTLAGVAIIAGLYYYFIVHGGESLISGAREPPGGREAQAARKPPTIGTRGTRADGQIVQQDNPVFRGKAKDEAKHSPNPVFTGGPRNEML